MEYKGEDTLKNNILEWLNDERHKQLFSSYVEKEYRNLFGGWSTDDIIQSLIKTDNSAELVGKINKMASEIGITALKIDTDGLIAYVKDIISGNKLTALVFVLDEFNEFIINNKGRLTDFQKLVMAVNEIPFYLVVVAHQISAHFHEKDPDRKNRKVALYRVILLCRITLLSI